MKLKSAYRITIDYNVVAANAEVFNKCLQSNSSIYILRIVQREKREEEIGKIPIDFANVRILEICGKGFTLESLRRVRLGADTSVVFCESSSELEDEAMLAKFFRIRATNVSVH